MERVQIFGFCLQGPAVASGWALFCRHAACALEATKSINTAEVPTLLALPDPCRGRDFVSLVEASEMRNAESAEFRDLCCVE
jgi:hypothetical protein